MSQQAPILEPIQYPFPAKPIPLSDVQKLEYKEKIKALLKARDAVLVAHY